MTVEKHGQYYKLQNYRGMEEQQSAWKQSKKH